MKCATLPVISENPCLHEHPLKLSHGKPADSLEYYCAVCGFPNLDEDNYHYRCNQCKFSIHLQCVDKAPEAYHASHPKHPLKSISYLPDYADMKCLLCGDEFEDSDAWYMKDKKPHHCDICNFSICRGCMTNPPPVCVVSSTTHKHRLHLVPRRMDFTCNACGTLGDRSPYFCLECNFMIHRECIDLPRVININRHDHRISYTRRLGHGESPWKCGVCRKKVDGFYGAYASSKFPSFVVHSRCATRPDVWDSVELEGMPEEEEIPPFEVVDDTTIRHFSHDHNLHINKDGQILHENIVCEACVFQIGSESFYSCRNCDFILHEKCANLPRKKRHLCHNQPFTLNTVSLFAICYLCDKRFSGFRYESKSSFGEVTLDVRCGSISEPFVHESHPHPLYYVSKKYKLSCEECVFSLGFKKAVLPKKVMWNRYDDHPLFLSYGESNVNGEYWCEACEAKLDPKEWFYTCNDCGITLHVPCVVGDFSYIQHGTKVEEGRSYEACSVSNTSICRPFCVCCASRCMLRSILKVYMSGGFVYLCSKKCYKRWSRGWHGTPDTI
ncbi:Cysteine/Histidine-rich C1 domain family protein [Raphanus sativus]|nr:Cysteine/Histidine-rich C1 domain family protein [Raphanus sativus]